VPLVFEWKVDSYLVGTSDYRTRLYISALAPKQGLWPDDPPQARNLCASPPSWTGPDGNPNRIYTSQPMGPGHWRIEADGKLSFLGGLADPSLTRVEVDAAYEHALTAGQHYYWGVQIEDTNFRKATTFWAAAVASTTPFNDVTVLTHGFQLNVNVSDAPFQQPADFMALADKIAEAGGGGVVLQYDKNLGLWKDPRTGKIGADALEAYHGKAVVLVMDWYKESSISDTGFAEAAADALFAALVDLNQATAKDLFASPLHFIGHSRGTVVNSEVIQRLGTYFPEVKNIQMTTLDPHDFNQPALNVPVQTLLNFVKALLYGGAAGAGFAANPLAAEQLISWAQTIEKAQSIAKALSIQLEPIAFGDFLDPDVQVWQNVIFADNYYQTSASPGGFTATPNGRSLPQADIDRSLTDVAGFGVDDFTRLGLDFGAGGTHSRVWQWYAGTVDTDALDFAGNPIFRRITDEGMTVEVIGAPIPGYQFNTLPWYFATPKLLTSNDPTERFKAANALLRSASQLWEGIGNGWFFSPAGGGAEFRAANPRPRTPIAFDNTEVPNANGTGPVPTVFNGDFEYGTRQALTHQIARFLTGKPELPDGTGRFPFSFQIPGWSMHGGEGFHITLPGIGDADIGGLFMVETDPASLAKELFGRALDYAFDTLFKLGAEKAAGNLLSLTAPQVRADLEQFVPGFSNLPEVQQAAEVQRYLASSTRLFEAADNTLKSTSELVAAVANQLHETPPDVEAEFARGAEKIKDLLGKGLSQGLDRLFPSKSDYALLMGGRNVIDFILDKYLPKIPDGIKDALLKTVTDFDTITHNWALVPDQSYLRFDVFEPFMLLPGAKLEVTFTDHANHSVTQQVDLGTGLFQGKTFAVKVPDEFKNEVAKITFHHVDIDPSPQFMNDLTLTEAIKHIAPEAAAKLRTASQIYLLDNIDFSDEPYFIDSSAAPLDQAILFSDAKGPSVFGGAPNQHTLTIVNPFDHDLFMSGSMGANDFLKLTGPNALDLRGAAVPTSSPASTRRSWAST
jgi:hypothetical protein